jgi:thiamine-monophosphate kinase
VNPGTPEFALIDRHFTRTTRRADVVLGVGDDGALLQPPAGSWLVLTTDTMVCGTHFLPTDDPEALGHKLVAVNLSDLAAMGADPAWLTLALTLPEIDHDWLAAFASGLFGLADAVGAELVGGDVTRGALTLTLQAAGTVPAGMALRRDGARPGDGVYVSGTLGDAALALALRLARATVPALLAARLDRPSARLALGRALRGQASAAIDVSDGLLADLGHLCARSGVGAEIDLSRLPRSEAFLAAARGKLDGDKPLNGGDDYELCFTLPAGQADAVSALMQAGGCPITHIGQISAAPGVRCRDAAGRLVAPSRAGFDHFTAERPT